MAFYRPASGASGGGGRGTSEAGCQGAQLLFEQVKSLVTETSAAFGAHNLAETKGPVAFREACAQPNNSAAGLATDTLGPAAGKSAALPELQVELKSAPAALGQDNLQLSELTANPGDLIADMSKMLSEAVGSPAGLLASLLSFLLKVFSEMAAGLCEALNEAMRAAAAAMEEVWKKQMGAAAKTQAEGLHALELCADNIAL